MSTNDKKRTAANNTSDDLDDMIGTFSRRVRVCDCGAAVEQETVQTEIDVCWTWLERVHPTVYASITHRGRPSSALFRTYVSNVYRGMRLVRPDLVPILGTVDSIAGNCRAYRRLVDMFPCIF